MANAGDISDETLGAILRRDRLIIVAGIVALTLASWVYLFLDARRMAAGHSCCNIATADLRSWFSMDMLLLAAMWSIMMVAMMAPTAGPMLLTFAAVNRRRRQSQRPYVPTGVFLFGYLLAWTLFSLLATAAQWALHVAALLSPAMVSTSRWLAGAILIAAGVFQFTGSKSACLARCRSPLSMIMSDWREGAVGALNMGLRHGLFCLGCCWALMLLLFVTGVMNLLWVAILSVFVLIEKISPARLGISWIAGALLLGWGAWVLTR